MKEKVDPKYTMKKTVHVENPSQYIMDRINKYSYKTKKREKKGGK